MTRLDAAVRQLREVAGVRLEVEGPVPRRPGVVDWDGAGRSHGYFDLYTLRFDLARRTPELGRWLAGRMRGTAPDEVVLACWANLSLRLVDWCIRHYTAPYVTTWLEVAESLRRDRGGAARRDRHGQLGSVHGRAARIARCRAISVSARSPAGSTLPPRTSVRTSSVVAPASA